MENVTQKEDWIIHICTGIIMNLCYFSSQQLVFSNLLLFGCFVSSYKKKVTNRIQYVFDFGKESSVDCVQMFNKDLEDYILLKNSISLSLFLIFTMVTIISVLFIYQTIQLFMAGGDAILMKLLFCSWCFALCLILIYLCLVADETEQTRQAYIDHMW